MCSSDLEVPQPQPRTKGEAIRLRTMSETAQSRVESGAGRLRSRSMYAKPNASLGHIPQSPNYGMSESSPLIREETGTSRARTQVYENPRGESVALGCRCKALIYKYDGLKQGVVGVPLCDHLNRRYCFLKVNTWTVHSVTTLMH